MSKAQSIPEKTKVKYDSIWALIEPFGRQHLNEEYLVLCQKMLGVLARKRPSPLVNGTPAAWASGIVRAVGWVNFLDDPATRPYMKMTDVDKAFGVSSGTGQGKSKTIRDLFKIRAFDLEWTVPSRIDSNPMVWLLQVNGMIVDIRHMSREIQEDAFRQGMIPYIPADQPQKTDDGDEE